MNDDRIIDIVSTIRKHEESIENLEKWQAKQNGKLDEIEKKLEDIKNLLIATLFSIISSLVVFIISLISGGIK
ncbi:MAG TPA: hypothetical protein PLR73_13370 [Acetivibrio sp.]|nr:hypothetical protein [Acetivibrio sp.]